MLRSSVPLPRLHIPVFLKAKINICLFSGSLWSTPIKKLIVLAITNHYSAVLPTTNTVKTPGTLAVLAGPHLQLSQLGYLQDLPNNRKIRVPQAKLLKSF